MRDGVGVTVSVHDAAEPRGDQTLPQYDRVWHALAQRQNAVDQTPVLPAMALDLGQPPFEQASLASSCTSASARW